MGNWLSRIETTSCNWARQASAEGWANTVRTVAATMSLDAEGTVPKMLRIRCTLHRCHDAPTSTLGIDAFNPACASEITSLTPLRPRSLRLRRNAVQNTSSSESPTSTPRTSRSPLAVTPVATTTAREMILWLIRALM